MPHSKRETFEVAERRARVAELYLRGVPQYEIVRRLGLGVGAAGRMKVSRDLKAIRAAWVASSVRDFGAAKGLALAQLESVERELWEAWDRSQRERGVVVTGGAA